MKKVTIKTELRKTLGKKAAKKLKAKQHIPCVLYGLKKENIHFHAYKNEFRKIIYTPDTFLIDIDIDGKIHNAIMHDIQFHPVTDDVIHIDFLRYSNEIPIKIELPVKTIGVAKGLLDGGNLQIQRSKLFVYALPEKLPEYLEVEVTDLELGRSIKVGDLSFEGVELIDPANSVVCAVKITRLAKSMTDEEAELDEETTEEEETKK